MQCTSKIELSDGSIVSCGQCTPCRVHKRREITGRLILESLTHDQCWFVTLTYDDENLPYALSDSDGTPTPTLLRRHLTGHVRSIRKQLARGSYGHAAGTKARFFAVGEYGDISNRPHYHAIIFAESGFDPFSYESAGWSKGFTQIAEFTPERAAYIAGYTVKKLNAAQESTLDGRYPEFAKYPQRPALACTQRSLERIASAYATPYGKLHLRVYGDIELSFRHGGKEYPLGRTVADNLRRYMGLSLDSSQRRATEIRKARRSADDIIKRALARGRARDLETDTLSCINADYGKKERTRKKRTANPV